MRKEFFTLKTATIQFVVEVKVFGEKVLMRELERAVGQYELYRIFLDGMGVENQVFMAVSKSSYDDFFLQKAIYRAVEKLKINLIVFNSTTGRITQWINWQNIEEL